MINRIEEKTGACGRLSFQVETGSEISLQVSVSQKAWTI